MAKLRKYSDVIKERVSALADLQHRKDAGEKLDLFVPTGLRDWDALGGIPYGVLTVLGAGTGEGKSIIAGNVVRAAAMAGLEVVRISQEDPADITADRDLAFETGINSKSMGLLRMDDLDLDRMTAALFDMEDWADRVHFYQGHVTPSEAEAIWKAHPKAALCVLDYLQAMITPKGQTKEEAIRLTCQAMEIDAQDTETHVLRAHFGLSQIKGEVEENGKQRLEFSRRKERPDITGFRPGPGSGDMAWAQAIAQHAKLVAYAWRPGRWERRAGISGAKDDRMEILLPKVSFAEEGRIVAGFDGRTSKLYDMERK